MPDKFLFVDKGLLLESLERLRSRIRERFPKASLGNIADAAAAVARKAQARAESFGKPNWWLRGAAFAVLAALFGLLAWVSLHLRLEFKEKDIQAAPAFVQFFEAALSSTVILGGASLFLFTLESRYKRTKTLAAIHELRSLAHIVDMHQLTKIPDHYLPQTKRTAAAPAPQYTLFEVGRYLDYCSELLAMVGKIAVIYVEKSSDPVVLEAVDQIEDLTNGLSRKIWQKLTILAQLAEGRGPV